MIDEIHAYLNRVHTISKEEVEFLLRDAKLQSFDRKEIITSAGQVQKNCLMVLKGVQRSYYIKDDKEHVIAFTYPVQLSGIPESFLTQTPSRYYLEAVTESEVLGIPFESLQRAFDTHHNLERLFRKIAEGILIAWWEGIMKCFPQQMKSAFQTS
jgi:cAMP-binding proteins - catabolite gene activator and regulatory subunit of cAMP-dependent protein kinases